MVRGRDHRAVVHQPRLIAKIILEVNVPVFEKDFQIPAVRERGAFFPHAEEATKSQLPTGAHPLRFAITLSDKNSYHCEAGILRNLPLGCEEGPESIFRFSPRGVENTDNFNVALLVPTGIGSEVGGHAGDAMPVARLLAQTCDTLITHPNVVNASDINEMPENSLYVEGSVVTRLMMGTVGLQRVRSNRVLVVIDKHKKEMIANAAINAVSAARASYGFNCPKVIQLDPPIRMKAEFTEAGTASGEIEGLDYLCEVLGAERGDYDAVALASVIQVPVEYHYEYFDKKGDMVNPWGGVEAMLTHTLSSLFNVPTAHAPMFESEAIANMDVGVVDPRMAAEAVSMTFLQCVLKGLQRSPRIITDEKAMQSSGVMTASDVSCLVIPDGCLGLPTIAALEQGITVIAVKENENLMKNDLSLLPWASGQFHRVENYWEAAGVLNALKAGIAPESVRRPLADTKVEVRRLKEESAEKAGKVTSE